MRKGASTVGIFAGFVPWIAYWALAGSGRSQGAAAAGLAAALALLGWQLRRGRPKAMELVAAASFSVHVTVSVALGPAFLNRYGAPLVNGVLAAIAWGTLLTGCPFTAQYAREDWPREYWEAPLFRRTNALLTEIWAVILTLNAALGFLSLGRLWARSWLVGVVPQIGIGAGVALSIAVPRCYPRRWAAQQIAARDPYRWSPPTFGSRRSGPGSGHDVIVVGAGIGGLTAGALLAKRGLKVLVLEQHYLPGGFCTSWPRYVPRGGHRLRYVFDAGVHDVSGLGPRGPVRHLLERLQLAERLQWRRVRHEYILRGLRLKVPDRVADFTAGLAEQFPAERSSIERFFAEMERVYRELYADVDLTGGVPRPPTTVEATLAYPTTHPHAFRWMSVSFGAMLDAHFRDPRLKQFLSVLTGYLSDNPQALTVGAMAPIFGYYFDGGYYPMGGSQALADALAGTIGEHGGEVRLRTAVRRILVSDGRAIGVEAGDGRIERAEAIVSNVDIRRTFLSLVDRKWLPKDFVQRVGALRPSTSAFAVFLGVDYVPDIEPITIQVGQTEGLTIAVPSKVDPSLAPPGHSSITLITLMPPTEGVEWNRKALGYTARKRRAGDALIAFAEQTLPGLRERIVYRQDGSPATFARYAWTTGGAIYGAAAGKWRPPAKAPVRRSVLAGAGVFPGAGVEAVIISGTLAADAIYTAGETPHELPRTELALA